jgi:hypothetical protein
VKPLPNCEELHAHWQNFTGSVRFKFNFNQADAIEARESLAGETVDDEIAFDEPTETTVNAWGPSSDHRTTSAQLIEVSRRLAKVR